MISHVNQDNIVRRSMKEEEELLFHVSHRYIIHNSIKIDINVETEYDYIESDYSYIDGAYDDYYGDYGDYYKEDLDGPNRGDQSLVSPEGKNCFKKSSYVSLSQPRYSLID